MRGDARAIAPHSAFVYGDPCSNYSATQAVGAGPSPLAFLPPSGYTITMVRNVSNIRYVPCGKNSLARKRRNDEHAADCWADAWTAFRSGTRLVFALATGTLFSETGDARLWRPGGPGRVYAARPRREPQVDRRGRL